MWTLALLLFLQASPPQREILGPYLSREDQGQTTKVVLKNGLTVIVREEYAIPLAGIAAHVKAGRFNEEDRISGISHVLERLLAPKTSPPGGAFSGTTYGDRTVYRATVAADNALTALGLQAEALLQPSFDAEALKQQVEAIVQANTLTLDTPGALASTRLYETAFSQHRMKRWNTVNADVLRALTPEDVTNYYQRYYRPSNMILSVVGAFDRERVLEEIVKRFAAAQDAPVEMDVSPPEPVQEGLRYEWRRGPIHQARVAMGFHIPGVQSEESRALEVLAAILWNGNASRFNEILRNGRSLITSGSGAVHGFGDLGFFEINLETLSPTEAASAALAELENIKRFGVSEEIVARAKTTLAVDYFRKLETVAGTAEQLAYFESLGDWKRLSIFLADVQKVTPQRVVDVTRRYLTSPNLSVFEYLPESVERYLTPAEYRVAVLDKVEGLVERRNVPELPVTAEIPQPRNALVADSVGTIQRRSILRGPDVYILEDRRLPTVSFGIFFPGGRLMETERQAGITELMLRTALRGTRNYSGQELARRIANAGVQLEVVNEPDFFGYALHGLAGRMDQAIQVLLDVLQNPLFEETEVLAERALHLARIQSASDDSEALSSSLFMRAVFGDHPYARNALGAEASISRLTGTQLREWFQQNQRKILPTIVIVGDARGTALIAPIADALTNEDLQSRDVLTAARPAAAPATGPSVETAVRQQSAMAYGFFGVNRSASERYAMDLAASLIAGRGLPNEGKVVNVTHSRGGVLRTSLAFPHEKEAEIRATLDAEFSKLRQGGITAGELNNAAQQAVGSRQASLQSRESRVLDYARAFYSGETLQSLARYEQAIRGVTMEQIRSVVERFLNPASLRIGMVRSAK